MVYIITLMIQRILIDPGAAGSSDGKLAIRFEWSESTDFSDYGSSALDLKSNRFRARGAVVILPVEAFGAGAE